MRPGWTSGPGTSRRLPPQLSAASRWSDPPRVGWATEPEGLGKAGSVASGTRPIAVSQETCRRRTNQAVGRGAPEAGDNHACQYGGLRRTSARVSSHGDARGHAMTIASNLGFPRIGRHRELKSALERFWSGDLDEAGLADAARTLRSRHWKLQGGHGISHVPSGDFSLYDHVLDTACMVGAIPAGYGWLDGPVSLPSYFALARGSRGTPAEHAAGIAPGLPALEMTKWFDTNYHYLVPRLTRDQRFVLTDNRPLRSSGKRRRCAPNAAGAARPGELSDAEQDRAMAPIRSTCWGGCCRCMRSCCGSSRKPMPPGCSSMSRCWRSTFGRGEGGTRAGIRHPAPRSGTRTSCSPAISARSVTISPRQQGCRSPACMSIWCAEPESWMRCWTQCRRNVGCRSASIDGRNIWRADLRAALGVLESVAARRGNGI